MFGRKIDSRERQDVLQLLVRWSQAITRIDKATNAMRFTMAEQPMGMQSEEFEETRLAAIDVLREVQTETSSPRFWPVLRDNKGSKMMLEFQMKLNESHAHQLNLLNLYGKAAEAFRRGREEEAPSNKEFILANSSFARVLDQMGKVGGKFARYYHISSQEYQMNISQSQPPETHKENSKEHMMEERDKMLADLHRVWEGLGEREKMLLHAANDGLISTPPHLNSRLETLRRVRAHVDRMTAEVGEDDNEGAALALLQRQSWWPEFIARVRAEKGIRIADDIGCWTNVTKKLAPYIYEAGRMYQTPEDYRKNGPITQWTWRVDLAAGTVETTNNIDKYDECINRLGDKVIGLSFALWHDEQAREEIMQNVQDRAKVDWNMVAFEYMICFQHLIDRYAFGLYGAQFRDKVMDSLYNPLFEKFAETGAVRANMLQDLGSTFIDTLNESNAEYGNYKLEKVIADEFSNGEHGRVMQSEERREKFLTICLNIDAINQDNAEEVLKGTLLWEFGKRIATIIDGTNLARVSAYVRNNVIAALLVIEPVKELKQLKELIDAINIP